MGVVTIYRLAEQALSLIEGGDLKAASSLSINEIKIACGQVINAILKTDYLTINGKMGEVIPNGSVLALYENIPCETNNGKSQATLPIKPYKLPRNMGVWGVYPKYANDQNYEYDKEFIPLQMGQGSLIKSQPLLNDLLGNVGYECYGDKLYFTKDIKSLFPDVVLAIRLVIMDISQYGDYDMLPVPGEYEWDIITQVYKMYSTQPIPDKVVDATSAEKKGEPLNQQKQSS
ncbi:MAG: hypothetical protein V4547_16960 [Bacteroidota bacterium]